MNLDNPVRGEIYWANLEPVKGSEQGRSRPVLIISNNLMNNSAPIVLFIPMTRAEEKVKAGPFNISYELNQLVLIEDAIDYLRQNGYYFAPSNGVFLCNQVRAASKQRLFKRIGKVSDRMLIKKIENALIHSFAFDACEKCGIPLRTDGLVCIKCNTQYRFKCINCGCIQSISHNFCYNCGKGVRE